MNERIKKIRKSVGLSQKDFGIKIGVSDTAISKIEHGERNPSKQTIKLICKEFKINQNWLKSGIGEMFSNDQDIFLDDLTELNSLGKRIKKLRIALSLSQREFGERIGIVKTAVSKIENGENSPREQTIMSICREFDVNESWLKEGIGDMFSNTSEDLFDQLANKYNLDEFDIKVIKRYVNFSNEQRHLIKDIFINEKGD